jgi:hypothetical protein
MQKQKKPTLTESQVKLKKLLTPIVEGIISEAESPITKRFIPFSEEMPNTNKMIFLIDKRGDYCVGFYDMKSGKLSAVGTPFRQYENLGTTQFTHWAV